MGGETIGVPSAAGNTEKLSGLSIQQRPGNRGGKDCLCYRTEENVKLSGGNRGKRRATEGRRS